MIRIHWYPETHETRAADPDDEWDRADTHTYNHSWTAVYEEDNPELKYLPTNGYKSTARPDDQVFAIIAEYSTGDTFGHDEGAVWTGGVFLTSEEAYAELDKLEALDEKTYYSKSFEDKVGSVYLPWFGYFESLERLWVERLTVQTSMWSDGH